MVNSPEGLIPDENTIPDTLDALRNTYGDRLPSWELVSLNPLLDSSNITYLGWNKIAELVYQRYFDFDGFVILHGTDTMAYTASALSFMLENLGKPVVLTGSQIPLSELRSDGNDNLINSILIAASDEIQEVCLYFGGKLFRGNRSTKISADQLTAFSSPNESILAEAGIQIRYFPENLRQPDHERVSLCTFQNAPIMILKIFPGIQFLSLDSLDFSGIKGLIVEAFGAGNIPSFNQSLLPVLEHAYNAGTVIVVCTQCTKGAVNVGTYETSKVLEKIGVVNVGNMTTEAAFTKLQYLFSKGYSKEQIKREMVKNLCGEIDED